MQTQERESLLHPDVRSLTVLRQSLSFFRGDVEPDPLMTHAGNHRARDAHVVPKQPSCLNEDAADLAVLDEDLVDVTDLFPIGPEHIGSLANQDVVATQVGDVLRGDSAD